MNSCVVLEEWTKCLPARMIPTPPKIYCKPTGGHLAGSFIKLVQFLADHQTGFRYGVG